MLKTLLSALVISGSLIATATLAYAQTSNELDSTEKSASNFHAADPAQAPVVLRMDPRTGTMSKLTLPAVPKSKEEAIAMIDANASKFETVPQNLIATTDDQAQAIQKVGELDKDGGTPSWYRYGGGGYGWRGGGYNYWGRGGWGYGYGYAPYYNYYYYNPYVYYPYYVSYYPCQGFTYGNYNYGIYYNQGLGW